MCLQSAQPTQNSSWWERSKNYAASFVPQFAQQRAKILRHAFLKRAYFLSYKLMMRRMSHLLAEMEFIKYKNPKQDVTENINNFIKEAFDLEDLFDPALIIHDTLSQSEKTFSRGIADSKGKNIFLKKMLSILNELKIEIDKALTDFIKNKPTKKSS